MTVEEYLKSINYDAKVEVLGELKNFKYYVEVDIPEDIDLGLPLVIIENKKKNTFEICDSDRVFDIIDLFLE